MKYDLQVYSNQTFPRGIAHQRRAFIRIHWWDVYNVDPNRALIDDDPYTRHFILTAGEGLVSSASVVRRTVTIDGRDHVCYGLSAVMTFPAFRRRGLGQRVVAEASSYIVEQPDAELALLWTSPDLDAWYSRSGWIGAPDVTTLVGDPADKRDFDSFKMLLLVSDEMKARKRDLLRTTIDVGKETW